MVDSLFAFAEILPKGKKKEERIKFQAKLLEVVDNAVIATNQNNEVIFWNSSAEKLYGWTEQEVLGRNITELNISEQSAHQVDEILKTLMGGKSWSGDFWVKRKDGSEFPAYVAESPIFDSLGNLIGIIGVSHDISERKRWEQKLVLSDRIFNHAIDMMCIAGFDGYFKTLNPSWTRTLGWSNEELLSKPWIDFVHPEDRDSSQKIKSVLIDGEEIFQFENRYLCKDGSYRWISWNSYSYFSENIIFGIARDVTYKKIAEEKILNSEIKLKEQVEEYAALNEELTQANEELRRLTEELTESNQRNIALLAANPDLMFVYSRDGVFLDFHTQNSQTLILNPHEFLNKKATEILPKFLADLNQTVIDKLFETDEPQTYSYSLDIFNETHHFDARMVKYGKDKALAIVRDITEKRKSEEQIRQLASMVDLAPSAIIIHDFEGNSIYTNQRNLDLHGYSKNEWMSLPLSQVDLPKSTDLFRERIDLIEENGEAYFEVEHYKKDGSILPMEIYAKRVNWDGKLVLLSIGTDISERKRYENKLKERDAQLSLALEVARIGYWKINLENNTVEWFAGHEKLFGISIEEFKGTLDAVQEIVHPDDRELGVHNLTKALNENVPFDNTYRVVHPNGKIRWLHSYGNLYRDNDGNPQYIFGISQDITKIKEEEIAIRESEEKYRLLFESNKDGIAIFETDMNNIPSHFTDANSSMAEMLGYSRDEFMGLNPNQFEQGLSHSDIERRISEMLTYGYSEFETKLKHKSGRIIDVSMKSVLIYYNNKALVYNIVRDISEKKRVEIEIKKTIELLNETQNLAHLGSWEFDLEQNILIWSDEAYRIFGFNPNEIEASYNLFVERVHPEDKERLNSTYFDSIKNNQSEYEIEHRIIRNDTGEIRYVIEKCYHERNESGKIIRSIGMVHDITERKFSEKLTNTRLKLLEYSRNCSVDELLGETLNEVENITNSKIGFYHFIDEETGMINLQKWSNRTLQSYCSVPEPLDIHYPIENAGVWADCIRHRKPIIHNNYDKLPNKKGMPVGHASLLRELVVPVIRGNKIVSILGVGNKNIDYTKLDLDIVSRLADTVWDIIERKIADEALKQSEAQFRLLFNNMTQGFALHEIVQNNQGEVVDYKYLDVNPAFEALTGLKRDYVLGKTVMEILPDTETFWIDIFGKVTLKGEEVKFENYSREIGKYFEVSAFSPQKRQFAVIFTDVTQRRQADEKIKLLSKGLEQSPAIVVITDAKGNIEYVNPTFSKITGYSLQEVIGKNPKILKSGNQDAEFYKNLWMTILRGEDWSGEMLNKKRNGVYYWESALISPIKDEDGHILHFIAIKEDITDRKKAEKALMQSETMLKEKNEELTIAWRKADESDKLKTAFLANMSHEIRTPMNAIIGFSEVLLRPNLSQEKYAYFGSIINDACMQLLSVVNDVIDIAKIETNQISLFEENVNINETIKRVASIFGRSAEKKKNIILFDLALPDELAFIRTDETKFSQIINNLISNAIKFTENGEITLGYKIVSNKINCFVKDTGIGISKENQQLIFERFRQVETSDSRKYGGTGLGLSISKAFVELMGGEIWVVSELGKGSEFHFSLPLKAIESTTIKKNQPKIEAYNFRGRTILIAEDEPANFTLLESWFEEEGVNILHVKDGAKAIELIKSNKDIDLVLMDIKMPIMDGIEATQQIRKFNTDIPIVALTAYALAGDKDKCIAAGCNSYLSKPLKRNDLMGLIGKFIGARPKQK